MAKSGLQFVLSGLKSPKPVEHSVANYILMIIIIVPCPSVNCIFLTIVNAAFYQLAQFYNYCYSASNHKSTTVGFLYSICAWTLILGTGNNRIK